MVYFRILPKRSRTVPLFKNGDLENTSSYRPISLVPVVGKIMEAVMKKQLVNYFESNDLFFSSQHGFRAARSTVTAVTELVSKIISAFENKEHVQLSLCDLSKAFDCIDHTILLKKLKKYGVDGVVYLTIKDYLTNRHQVVSVKGAISQEVHVERGVPQGSVLGPLLFIIYINDLSCIGNTLLYADDTTLITSGGRLDSLVIDANLLFEAAKDWFLVNRLKINDTKTQNILCSTKRPTVVFNHVSESVKLLGFWIDNQLTWEEHIRQVSIKLSRVIYLLRKLKKEVSEQYLIMVYYGIFHSHLNYGLQLWGHAPYTQRLFRLQKRAVRILTGSKRRDHCRPLFSRLGIMTIHSQYVFNSVVFVKRNIDLFKCRGDIHTLNTRSRNLIDAPFCRLSKTANCFPNLAIKLYNSVDEGVKKLPEKVFFKRMSQELKVRPLYTVEEFFEDPTSAWTC